MDTPVCSYRVSSPLDSIGQNSAAPWSQKHESSANVFFLFVQNWFFFNLNELSSRYCCQFDSHIERCGSIVISVRPWIECSPFDLLQFCWPHAALTHSRLSIDAVDVPGNGKQIVRTFKANTNGSDTNINCSESGSASFKLRTSEIVRSWYGSSSFVVPKSHSPARTRSIVPVWCLLAAVNTTEGWINEPAPEYNSVCWCEFRFSFRNIATVHGYSPQIFQLVVIFNLFWFDFSCWMRLKQMKIE